MKALTELTVEQLIKRALATAITLMVVWSASICFGIFNMMIWLASFN